jgi:tetratricopeptide (TPR) repeat protein
VVPFRPNRPLGIQALLFTTFALLLWLVPTLDPLGRVEAATRVEQEKARLQQAVEGIRRREQQVAKKLQQANERTAEIDRRTQEMLTALRRMKPAEKRPNSEVLRDQQQQLNQLWNTVSSDSLREMLAKTGIEMQSGEQSRRMNEWLRELQQGNPEQLRKELEKSRESMQALLNAKTPEERTKAASELRRQLQDLKKFSSKKAGSKELEQSLDQALKALESLARKQSGDSKEGEQAAEASSEELAEQARQALEESLELAQKELEDIARSAEDIQKIEQALKTLQQAEKLNQNGQMDGEQCEGCRSVADYAARLKKMQGSGEGEGEVGGRGGMMSEDDSDPEGYKDERTRAQVTAGKLLLSIRTREAATEKDFDPEELRNYQNSVSEVRNGVQAAIEAEEIPPGYVDGIRQYFDSLESAPTAPAAPQP